MNKKEFIEYCRTNFEKAVKDAEKKPEFAKQTKFKGLTLNAFNQGVRFAFAMMEHTLDILEEKENK